MRALRWLVAALLVSGCTDGIVLHRVDEVTFVDAVDNPYFPLPSGARWVYSANDGREEVEITVDDVRREIMGVSATSVTTRSFFADGHVEESFDYYAQDSAGNVWHLGESICVWDGAQCVSDEGSFEWGINGALPGMVMPAQPEVDGQPYYQELWAGHAETIGEVTAIGVSTEVAAGSYDDCVRIRQTSSLDPLLDEDRTYCAGVGNVRVMGELELTEAPAP
jgi:hypothetical protein